MNNEMATFQERVFEKIKGQVGELIGPEEARKLVDTAIHKAFFEDRIESGGSYRSDTRKPSLFVEMVTVAARPVIEQAVKDWLKDHEAEVVEATKKELAAGFAKFIAAMVGSVMSQNAYAFISDLQSKGILPRA